VIVVADRLLERAYGHPAAAAVHALAARDGGDDLHAVPARPTAGAGLDDLAADLVADHPGRHDVVVAVAHDLDVGAARRAAADADQHVAGARPGLGGILDPEVAGGVEAGDLHANSSSWRGVSSKSTSSTSQASRSACARSGSSRISASSASTARWSSPRLAI